MLKSSLNKIDSQLIQGLLIGVTICPVPKHSRWGGEGHSAPLHCSQVARHMGTTIASMLYMAGGEGGNGSPHTLKSVKREREREKEDMI